MVNEWSNSLAEIIRAGKLPEDQWYDHHCGNCHTHFKFQKKELKVSSDQRDGTSYSITCPFCKSMCWFYSLNGKNYNPPTVDPY